MKITKIQSGISQQIKKDIRNLEGVAEEAYRKFVQVTPIDKGNARRRTRLERDTIVADYPYAKRLDEGWSKQAPKGMWQPTLAHIRKYIKKLLGN